MKTSIKTKMNKNWISNSIGKDPKVIRATQNAQEEALRALNAAMIAKSGSIEKKYKWHYKFYRMRSLKWGPTYVIWSTSHTARANKYLVNSIMNRIGLKRKR